MLKPVGREPLTRGAEFERLTEGAKWTVVFCGDGKGGFKAYAEGLQCDDPGEAAMAVLQRALRYQGEQEGKVEAA